MSIFYLLSTGPREIYCYDSFKWKPPRCNYYVTSETTPWRGSTDKPKRKEEKSHAISQSLNIVTIDKPIDFEGLPRYLWKKKKKTTLKKTILKRTISKKTPISAPGQKSHSVSIVKTWTISLDKVAKFYISPISPKFIFFLTDSGSPPRKFGWYGSKKNIESRHSQSVKSGWGSLPRKFG